MTQHRFFIKPEQIKKELVTLSGNQARQIAGVLRLSEGDRIHVLDNQGWGYEVELEMVKSVKVVGRVQKKDREKGEPSVRLTVYQSMLKRDNFEWVLQKGTELGVSKFVPMISQRTIVRLTEIKKNKRQRWERIIIEAAEQSGRGIIPALSQPVSLQAILSAQRNADLTLIPWEKESARSLLAALKQNKQGTLSNIGLIIGPEGGFAEEEISAAVTAGIIPVTLGPRILRAETAAIAASALLLSELGEMN